MKKRKCIMKNMETGAEDKNQQTAIYVMTHKAFTPPPGEKSIARTGHPPQAKPPAGAALSRATGSPPSAGR